MKISKVRIQRFKRFRDETFDLDGHVVIAGPNNCGKTTLLQAIATWSLALERWLELNNFRKPHGVYQKAPIARHAFYSVPLRNFDLLWNERLLDSGIVIEIDFGGISIPIEILGDSSEQSYVRPSDKVGLDLLRNPENFVKPVFVPPMTGLNTEEPEYRQPKINQLLGRGKPGNVLRNLLVKANSDQAAWERLTASIDRMFHYELLPPNTDGPDIIAEYRHKKNGPKFDIASAGSGFLQVLMLMAFLHSQRETVLLLDEPDAHLHVILQDVIYKELRTAAQESNSQLIIATHSEIVINAVEPRELCALLDKPRKLAGDTEKAFLIRSLSTLTNMDLMLAMDKKKILYVEGHTDLDILRAWATNLKHRLVEFFEQPLWKPSVSETRTQARGIKAQDHFESLLLAQEEIRGVQISDRDGKKNMPDSKIEFDGKLLKLCWKRYEIENYLIHPAALSRFVGKVVGADAELANVDNMQKEMREHLPGAAVENPMNDSDVLIDTKMRKNILPAILSSAGLPNLPYTRYMEIAAVMQPDEIHPEIKEKLDAIANHFGL